jgi:NAD-dependent deacetylase
MSDLQFDFSIPEFGNLTSQSTIVVLSGAGVSQESGIKTFRDNSGLWEEYDIYDVATPEAWQRNQELVLRFYNERRKQLMAVEPNDAHKYLARLGEHFNTHIITQNVDDLHERAGSVSVLHLHGELKKVRSSVDDSLIYDWPGWELKKGDLCENGSQLRPHVVWFGEMVPMIAPAADIVRSADLIIVVGTSLNVYPAAGLLYDVKDGVPIVVIDPSEMNLASYSNVFHIRQKASVAVKNLVLKMLAAT